MTRFKGKSLLVVDDEEGLRDAIASQFRRMGFDVEEACSGNEAFERVRGRHFDVILSDVRMPNGTGLDLLENLKTLEQAPPLILMTGYADVTRDQVVAAGAITLMSKPFALKELMDTTEQALVARAPSAKVA